MGKHLTPWQLKTLRWRMVEEGEEVPLPARMLRRSPWEIFCTDRVLPLKPGDRIELDIHAHVPRDAFLTRVRNALKRYVNEQSPFRYSLRLTARNSVLIEVKE